MSKDDKKSFELNAYGTKFETTETETVYEIDGQKITSPAGIRLVNIKGKKLILLPSEVQAVWASQKNKEFVDYIQSKKVN